jgi:serine kinase of HPr protein (carbohydrate metabolism regulator)
LIRHAGLVAARGRDGAWRGALIEGPSGAGKSGLALGALDAGLALVADDRVMLWTSGGRLFGRAPDALAGLIEVRGLDVLRVTPVALAEVSLVIRLGAAERIPDLTSVHVLGLQVPLLILDTGEFLAPAKLSRALAHFDGAVGRRI